MSFMRNSIAAICIAVMPSVATAATVILDSFGASASSTSFLSVSSQVDQGLVFTASSGGTIASFDARFQSGPAGTLNMSLYTFDGSGLGALLETQSIQYSGSGPQDVTFGGWSSQLIAGESYGLIGSTSLNGFFQWQFTTDPVANSLGRLFSVNGAEFTSPLTPIARVTLDVAPVPLPAGVPLVLTGILAFGVMSRRKKTA